MYHIGGGGNGTPDTQGAAGKIANLQKLSLSAFLTATPKGTKELRDAPGEGAQVPLWLVRKCISQVKYYLPKII